MNERPYSQDEAEILYETLYYILEYLHVEKYKRKDRKLKGINNIWYLGITEILGVINKRRRRKPIDVKQWDLKFEELKIKALGKTSDSK